MLEQKFKEPDLTLVVSNLQIIKQNLSVHISESTQKNMFDISVYIDKICKMKNKNKMSIALETLVKKFPEVILLLEKDIVYRYYYNDIVIFFLI